MKRTRKPKEKTYVRMLAKFGWKNKNKWKETNIEGGGKKTKGQGGIAGRKRMMGIDSEYESMSMKRAEKSKAKHSTAKHSKAQQNKDNKMEEADENQRQKGHRKAKLESGKKK